jgi:hypothetical protein
MGMTLVDRDRTDRTSIMRGNHSLSRDQQQSKFILSGGMLMVVGLLSGGVGTFVSKVGQQHQMFYGQMLLVDALFATTGAIIIATSDIDVDVLAKRQPICVFAFAFAWSGYEGLYTLLTPIQAFNQVHWIAALPFMYLLLCFRPVLQMRSDAYPRFSDLFIYSLSLDILAWGPWNYLFARIHSSQWFNVSGSVFLFSGLGLFMLYWRVRSKYSRRLALSISVYGYLLAYGFGDLSFSLVNQYAYNNPSSLIDYSFAIIHITFPLAYFALQTFIHRFIGRRWLIQRRDATQFRLMQVLETRGNLVEVETAITVNADLNAFVFFTKEDELTLLHLAVLNEHHDSVQRLLQTGEVQANKASGSKGCTALFLAAELGRVHAAVLLLEHAADVNMLADDDQSPLIVATANRHTKVAALLREHGANENHKWMGLRGKCIPLVFGTLLTTRSLVS